MKHLVKFNEDQIFPKWNEDDIEYFNNCFIDFIDKGDKVDVFNRENRLDEDLSYWSIHIHGPKQESLGISDFIKSTEEALELYKNIENSIEKVKLKYPYIDLELDFQINKNGINSFYISIFIDKK